MGGPAAQPHLTIVAFVRTDDAVGTTPYSTGSANAQKTLFEAQVNPWMALVGCPAVNL